MARRLELPDLPDYAESASSTLLREEDELPPLYKIATSESRTSSLVDAASSSVPHVPISPLSPLTPVFSNASTSSDPNAPPAYSSYDAHAKSFAVDGDLVCSTVPTYTPRYQLCERKTESGKTYQLGIRRLMNLESRRLSLPARGKAQAVEYDDDATMYTMTNWNSVVHGVGAVLEIKGCRASCIRGVVKLETSIGLRGRSRKFFHVTKNHAMDSLKEENERRIQKYGYHSKTEYNKDLLFSVKPTRTGAEWTNAAGRQVATEEDNGLQLTGNEVGEVDRKQRDLLVTCWIAKSWVDGNVKF